MAQKPDPNTKKEAHLGVGEHRMTMEDWLGAFPVGDGHKAVTELMLTQKPDRTSVTQPGNRQGEPSS